MAASPAKRGRDGDAVEEVVWPPTSGGYDASLFLQPPDDDFDCPVCQEVLCDPVQCQQGHMMCRTCSTKWLAEHASCPTCRDDLSTSTSMSVSRAVANMVDKMLVRCPHHAGEGSDARVASARDSKRVRGDASRGAGAGEGAGAGAGEGADAGAGVSPAGGAELGCTWTGAVSTVEEHLDSDCGFEPHACPNEGCLAEQLRRKDAEAHAAECEWRRYDCPACSGVVPVTRREQHDADECPKRQVTCSQMCGATMAADEQEDHIEDDCPNTIVACPMDGNGCDNVKRCELDAHVSAPAHLRALMTELVATRNQLAATHAALRSTVAGFERRAVELGVKFV